MSLNRINFCHCKHLNLTYGIALGLLGLGLGKESPKNTTPTACGLWLVACGLWKFGQLIAHADHYDIFSVRTSHRELLLLPVYAAVTAAILE